jgi:hypothetical protein
MSGMLVFSPDAIGSSGDIRLEPSDRDSLNHSPKRSRFRGELSVSSYFAVIAILAAAVRVSTPSFKRICSTCLCTVRALSESITAISQFVLP